MANNIRKLIELRIASGHYENFKEIAAEMEFDPGAFSRMINNTQRKLTAVQIQTLAKILGMPIHTLVEWLSSDEQGLADISEEQLEQIEQAALDILSEISELQTRVNQLEAINERVDAEISTSKRTRTK